MNTEDKQPKDDFVYFNDEWNSWEDVPKDENNLKKLTIENSKESPILKLIKNNKPDGRRYKK